MDFVDFIKNKGHKIDRFDCEIVEEYVKYKLSENLNRGNGEEVYCSDCEYYLSSNLCCVAWEKDEWGNLKQAVCSEVNHDKKCEQYKSTLR